MLCKLPHVRMIEELAGWPLASYHSYYNTALLLVVCRDVMAGDWVTFHTVLLIELMLITWIKAGCIIC